MLGKKDRYSVAVVGATGAVGNEVIEVLEQRAFPVERIRFFASERSAGTILEFEGSGMPVEVLDEDSFKQTDIALFSAGEEISRRWAPVAVRSGCVVVDNSNEWRMDPNVPLVVPEVNARDLQRHRGIIANPTSSTILTVMVLKSIHDATRIRRIVVTTLQSVSGTGKKGMDELLRQTTDLLNFREVGTNVYPYQIAFDVLPHVDAFLDNGYTSEEMSLVHGTRKIMGDGAIRVTATAVRVPVFRGHCASVNVETEDKLTANEARALLAAAPGIVIFDAPEKNLYPHPLGNAGDDEVYVGRIREDESVDNGLNLWIVTDNLRKGAALNEVQIAEELIRIS
ncbi:MAG: aspartate-semialdehyde dehydrogenase [Chloroflexota bacterium]